MKSSAHKSTTHKTSPHLAGLYDICIIGGGVAGLSAALFVARRGCSVCVVSADWGGQTASTAEIENYPGLGRIEGPDLVNNFLREAKEYGAAMHVDTIAHISCNEEIILTGTTKGYSCRALIIATGKSPRRLGVPGEQELFGRGVAYAGALNVRDYDGMRVAVVGGGNSALDVSTRIAPFALQTTIIHRRDEFFGEQVLRSRLANTPRISPMLCATVKAIRGVDRVTSVTVAKSDGEEEIPIDAVIIAAGFEPRADLFRDHIACTEDGRITIDDSCRTSRERIFAAGDCTTVPFQQIVISAGEGAKAALSAVRFLQEKEGKRQLTADWGFTGKQP